MTVSHSVRHNIESIKSGHYKSFQNHQNIARTVMLKNVKFNNSNRLDRNELRIFKLLIYFVNYDFCQVILVNDF